MTIDIKTLSEKDLKAKIENIKAEREKTANALKRYEDELEKRKKPMPLGIPSEGKWCVSAPGNPTISLFDEFDMSQSLNHFATETSAKIHSEMMIDWRKALVNSAKGEPIDIKVLLPLMKKGKVLYSPYDEKWKWLEPEAIAFAEEHGWYIKNSQVLPIEGFNIKPAENWENSLMECGL